jgi:hypothetical protein
MPLKRVWLAVLTTVAVCVAATIFIQSFMPDRGASVAADSEFNQSPVGTQKEDRSSGPIRFRGYSFSNKT